MFNKNLQPQAKKIHNLIYNSIKLIVSLSLILSLSQLLQIKTPALAQENPTSARQDLDQARGLIVSPSINELDMEPGQKSSLDITLENDSQQDAYNITTVSETFEASDEEGIPIQRPFLDSEAHRTWISFNPSKTTIEDGKKVNIKVNVEVPTNAEAGSYFYALVFTPTPTSEQTLEPDQVGLKTINRISALLFLNVRGQTQRKVEFETFEVSNLSPNLPGVNRVFDPFFDIVNIDYNIQVDGNFSYRPAGNILFFNTNNDNPVFSPTINPNNKIVIAGTSRNFGITTLPSFQVPVISRIGAVDTQIKEDSFRIERPWFGNQKVQANLTYLNNNGVIERVGIEKEVFFFPWKSLLLVLICASLIYGIYLGHKNLSKNKNQDDQQRKNRLYID